MRPEPARSDNETQHTLVALAIAVLLVGALYVRLSLLPDERVELPQVLASPDILYVSPLGDDANPGTRQAPVATLRRAAEMLQPGDTLLVAPGTYDERAQITAKGTAEKPVEVIATSDGRPTLVTEGINVSGSHVTVSGFEVSGSATLGDGKRNSDGTYADGAVQAAGDHITLRDLSVHDTKSGPWAILAQGDGNVIEDCVTSDAFKGHISVAGNGVVVRRNRATVSPGFFDDKPPDYKSTLLLVGFTSKMLVEDNYLRGPCDGNLVHVPVPVSHVTFRRNIILQPGVRSVSVTHTQTFGFYGSSHDLVFDGNVIGSAQPLPDGFAAGFTHFFFGTSKGDGSFEDIVFRNNVLLGQNDGAYYLQFKAWDHLRALTFDNNVVNIESGWRLPDDARQVRARRNVVLRGSIGGHRDLNLYAGGVPSGEGSGSWAADPVFVHADLSKASEYGARADWRLKKPSSSKVGVSQSAQ